MEREVICRETDLRVVSINKTAEALSRQANMRKEKKRRDAGMEPCENAIESGREEKAPSNERLVN